MTEAAWHKPEPSKRVRVDVFHHFIDPLTLNLSGSLNVIVTSSVPPIPAATRAILTIQPTSGGIMPGAITVDTTNETATVEFVDDKGDVATAPVGVTVLVTSSDPSLTVGTPDPSTPNTFPLVPTIVGSADVSATFTNADGTPAIEPNGTPFSVTSTTVTIAAGAAAGASLVLSV